MVEKVTRIRRKRRIRPFPGLEFFPFLRHELSATRLAIIVASIVLGLVLGLIFLSYGSKAYNRWNEARLLQLGSRQLQQQDYAGAVQSAQRALAIHRDSLRAFYI